MSEVKTTRRVVAIRTGIFGVSRKRAGDVFDVPASFEAKWVRDYESHAQVAEVKKADMKSLDAEAGRRAAVEAGRKEAERAAAVAAQVAAEKAKALKADPLA